MGKQKQSVLDVGPTFLLPYWVRTKERAPLMNADDVMCCDGVRSEGGRDGERATGGFTVFIQKRSPLLFLRLFFFYNFCVLCPSLYVVGYD